MSYGAYREGIPLRAVEERYVTPTDLGGARANYPIVSCAQQYGLFNEVRTDWNGVGSQLWESVRGQFVNGDISFYPGDVWSIQLSARPGYYVTSEQLEELGYSEEDFPPMG